MTALADVQDTTRRVHLISLGCPRNLVDSEVMLGCLLERGWQFTTEPEDADAIVINTCGFVNAAKQESVTKIIEAAAHKQHNPELKLIVAGCLAQRYRSQLRDGLPEVDLFIGTDQFHNLANLLDSPILDRAVYTKRTNYIYSVDDPRINTLSPYSAYVKISEGCQHRCTFCSIPAIRGPLRSRTIADIEQEVEQLVAQGVVEIILIAQDLAAFGRDGNQSQLLPLLKRLVAVDGLSWLRLLYIYPEYISEEFLEFFADNSKIVKYLDIPVQHASDRLLKLMARDIDSHGLSKIFATVRERVPTVAIRTSVMVGFPSETEQDFACLLSFVEQQQFEHLGCFAYSQENNTVAGRMKQQLSSRLKKIRRHQVMTLQKSISQTHLQRKISSIQQVLVEKDNTIYSGRLTTQAPEVDGLVYINHGQAPLGTIQPVKITASSAYDLSGEFI